MSPLPLPAVGRMQRLAPDQQDTLREVGRRFREEAARAVTSIPLADALSPFGWHTWMEPAGTPGRSLLAHLDGACCRVGAGPSGTEGGLQEDPNPASSREVL